MVHCTTKNEGTKETRTNLKISCPFIELECQEHMADKVFIKNTRDSTRYTCADPSLFLLIEPLSVEKNKARYFYLEFKSQLPFILINEKIIN